MDESHQGEDVNDTKPVFRELSIQQLCRGARFAGDIEQDFELDDLYFTDEESDDELWKLGPETEAPEKRVNLHTPPLMQGLADACEDVTPDGGVKKLVLEKGTGFLPPKGAKIMFHYVGFIGETLEKFDASTQRGGRSVIVDDENCDLITGLRIAIKSMQIKEVAQVLIQPTYAFGSVGCPPRIPPECQVVFNVRMVSIIQPSQVNDPVFMSRAELRNLNFTLVLDAAKRVRKNANDEFSRSNFSKAVRGYRHAIDMLEDFWKVSDDQHSARGNFLASCFCNLALSYLRLNKGPQACNACKNGLHQPSTQYVDKLLYRFARAKLMVGALSDARSLLQKALDAGADAAACTKVRQQIDEQEASDFEVESDLAKRMLQTI